MKTLIQLICLFGLFLVIAPAIVAQELITGGNMEDESAWQVINYKAEESEYEFNFIGDGPAEGQGGCLEVTATGTDETDIIFYQELTLTGGADYELKGTFKDLTGTIENFWCEILYDTSPPPPPDSGDFGGAIIVGFNTWDGTTAGIDGTFQDDYAKGDGPIFTAPGEEGVPTTVYFVIDVGCWMGGSSYFFDVAIDEISLTPVGGTDVKRLPGIVNDFALNQNYPNPFNPQTTISFSLPEESFVTLKVYDAAGREVETLLQNERNPAGNYEVPFNATNLPSGIYFYRLQTDKFTQTKSMALVK